VRRARIVATVALGIALASCTTDPADRPYLAALRGEETGMTRIQQIALIDQAIEMAPSRAYYFETRAIYKIDLHQFDLALTDLDRDIALGDRPYARFLRGLVRCQSGDYAGSLADFDAAIAGQPDNTQFYRGRSLARAAVGDGPGALEDAEHLVAVVPQQAESYYARGIALVRLGRTREAIPDFDQAVSIRPELVYPLEARARAYDQLGDRARADADRAAVDRVRADSHMCGNCTDPFRY
jgi:tetratricopeptide (TPR) repeat protein